MQPSGASGRYIGLEHITSDGAINVDHGINAEDLTSSKFSFTPSHILFGKLRPYLRKVARPSFPGICSTDILPIHPNKGVDKDYLFHYLRTPGVIDLATARSSGANLPRISPSILSEFLVPVPPLEEQRRIAAILDKAEAIRRRREQAIKLADEFLRSLFLDMFGDPIRNPKGWHIAPLSSLSLIRSGVTKGRVVRGQAVEVPYMRVANVQDGHIDLSEIKTIAATAEEITRYSLMPGDVLLTEGGDPDKLGRGAVWEGEIAKCIHQNHVFCVRPDGTRILPDYLSALMGSALGKRYFLSAAKQTTGIASINKTQLSGFPVLVPDLSLQRLYSKAVGELKVLKQRQQQQIRHSTSLFASLMHRAFRGELLPFGSRKDQCPSPKENH